MDVTPCAAKTHNKTFIRTYIRQRRREDFCQSQIQIGHKQAIVLVAGQEYLSYTQVLDQQSPLFNKGLGKYL